MIKKIFKIIKKKNKIATHRWKKTWVEKPETYLTELKGEIKEVEAELSKKSNIIYLEDELGDILWDYLNILWLLDKEKRIKKERVLKKCVKKFTERIDTIADEKMNWQEIKDVQKKRLKDQHARRYGK